MQEIMSTNKQSENILYNSTGIKKVFYPMNKFIFGSHAVYGMTSGFESVNFYNWTVYDKNRTKKLPSSYLFVSPKINQLFKSRIDSGQDPNIDSWLNLEQGNFSMSYFINNFQPKDEWKILSSNGSVVADKFPKNRSINSTFFN